MCAARRLAAAAALGFGLSLPAPAAADVLVVGDSLGVGTTPHLRAQLDGVRVDGDSRIGRPSPEGVRVLADRIRGAHEVVVFDLGTNDDPGRPQVLATDLAAARRIAGERCMVVATLNRPPLNGVPVDRLNEVVERFAAGDERVEVVDWQGVVAAEPALLAADRVHATPAGYAARGELFADAVRQCLEPDRAAADPEDGDFGPPPRRRRRPAEREVPVPGIESSGVVFSEPVEWDGMSGSLLLPGGEGPHAAVVLLPGEGCALHRAEAERLAQAGLAALVYDRASCDDGRGFGERADAARDAVAALTARRDIRSIAIWAAGEAAVAAPLVAAGNTSVDAVVVYSAVVLPPVRVDEWEVRTALAAAEAGSATAAVSSAWRLTADDDDRSFDPAPHWRGVTQPVLALWDRGGGGLPSRANAEALLAALEAGRNEDRTFAVVEPGEAGALTSSWLRDRLARRPARAVTDTPLPPPAAVEPVAVERTGALAGVPVQAAWLGLPLLMLLAGAVAGRGRATAPGPAEPDDPSAAPGPAEPRASRRLAVAVVLLDVLALAAIAGAVVSIIAADGHDVAAFAGMPAAIAGAIAITAGAAIATIVLAARRPRAPLQRAVLAASAVWLGLALYWLI